MKRLTRIFALAAIVVTTATLSLAGEPLNLQKMGNDLRKNQEELRTYEWNSRVTFLVDGVQRRTDVYQVRYDENGWLLRMQTGSEVAKGAVRRPDGKKLSKKEREAALIFIIEAKNQLDAYLSPLFAEKAVTTATVTQKDGTIRMQSRGVVHKDDSVEILFSSATQEPKNLRAIATIDGSPMSLDVTFGAIDYGPFHSARSVTVTSWNGFELTILTENSNYTE